MEAGWLLGATMALGFAADGGWTLHAGSSLTTVNDRVMGGVSQSTVEATGEGFVYSGTLSRDQGGGFVSMRVTDAPLDVVGAEGLELSVRGDGRTYELTASRSDVPLRAGSYRAPFEAGPDWTTVRIPFARFVAMQRGEDVVGAPALDGDLGAVERFGVLLTDGPEGPFRLEVRSMGSYGQGRERQGSPARVVGQLVSAIEAGVRRFNQGDAEGCRTVYRDVLTSVADASELTDGERVAVLRALREAEPLPPEAAAWRLRYAIDALVPDLRSARRRQGGSAG